MNNGRMQEYYDVSVLIHNVLFQLLSFSYSNKKKYVVVFNDQLSKSQLRILHLKSLINRG